MKWTVLSDNRTLNPLFKTEHGLCIFLETDRHRMLLDTGASRLFADNAESAGIDLRKVDYVFVSHGHSDHAGGLRTLMAVNEKAKVIVSVDALKGKYYSERGSMHSITPIWPDLPAERLISIDKSCEVAEGLHVVAHIQQKHALPKGDKHLYVKNEKGELVLDDFRHELALYTDGLLFTGCAHSGLENILEACRWPVHTVVGGFHLLDNHESEEELLALGRKLKEKYPETSFYTSHCTGEAVFNTLKKVMGTQLNAFSCGCSITL